MRVGWSVAAQACTHDASMGGAASKRTRLNQQRVRASSSRAICMLCLVTRGQHLVVVSPLPKSPFAITTLANTVELGRSPQRDSYVERRNRVRRVYCVFVVLACGIPAWSQSTAEI